MPVEDWPIFEGGSPHKSYDGGVNMFEHLDDPRPPEPDGFTLEAVKTQGERVRRRRLGMRYFLAGSGLLAAVAILIAAIPQLSEKTRLVTGAPSGTTSGPVEKGIASPSPAYQTEANETQRPSTPAKGHSAPASSSTPPTTEPPRWDTYPLISPAGRPHSKPPPSLKLILTLAREEIRSGDTVEGTLTAENTSDQTININRPSTCETLSGFYQDGEHVGSPPPPCGATQVEDELLPGEIRNLHVTFLAYSVQATPRPMQPGVYGAFAGLNTHDGWFAPGVRVTILAT